MFFYTIVCNLQCIRYAARHFVKKSWKEEIPMSVCASNWAFSLILKRYKTLRRANTYYQPVNQLQVLIKEQLSNKLRFFEIMILDIK